MKLLSGLVVGGLFLSSAALAAEPTFRAPTAIPPPPSPWAANLEFYFGHDFTSGLNPSEDPNFLGVSGAASFDMGGWGIQADLFGDGGLWDDEYGWNDAGFGVHLYKRDAMRALGIFANLATYGDTYNDYNYFRYALGAELQKYAGQWTIYGQAAFLGKLVDDCDCGSSGFYGKLEARFFTMPDMMLAIRGETYVGEINEDGDRYTRSTLGLRGEVKLNDPISIFGDVAWSNNTHTGDSSFTDVSAKIGLNLNLNSKTLLDKDRRGPSFTQPFVGLGEGLGLWEF